MRFLEAEVDYLSESNGIYIISRYKWTNEPTKDCTPIYIYTGSNPGKSKRFRTRIGDLIADLFGFLEKKQATFLKEVSFYETI